jgi:hypothetical protein
MIVLACSLKLGGRCVAGVSTDDLSWIRPVSAPEHGELYVSQCGVEGRLPAHLEIVRFEHSGNVEDPAQPENVLIKNEPWELVGELDAAEAYQHLEPLLTTGPVLLENRGKAVPDHVAQEGVAASLALVEPSDLRFTLAESRHPKGSPRALFALAGQEYSLPLTESLVRPRLFAAGFGTYDFADLGLAEPDHALLTVSLAEPDNDWRSKLIAAVIGV